MSIPNHRDLFTQAKPIGMLLKEADLVLQDQIYYPDLRVGEIMAMRGWLKSETVDFFVQHWSQLLKQTNKKPLGYYLERSVLLEPKHIETILKEQRKTAFRFGSIAVLQGLIKPTTLDFFLMYLFPEEVHSSFYMNLYKTTFSNSQQISNNIYTRDQTKDSLSNSNIDELEDSFEIKWIG